MVTTPLSPEPERVADLHIPLVHLQTDLPCRAAARASKARATTSFPVPLSPVIKTVASLWLKFSIKEMTRIMALERATRPFAAVGAASVAVSRASGFAGTSLECDVTGTLGAAPQIASFRPTCEETVRDWYTIERMRRALLIAVLVLLIGDASGVSSLFVPEACAIGTIESVPDSGCPAFCVRCSCACCASSVVHKAAVAVPAEVLTPILVPVPDSDRLPTGSSRDILHVPKPVLT
jgi:hypothetical protein